MIAKQVRDHDGQEGRRAAGAPMLSQDGTVVLEQLQLHLGHEVLGVGVADAIPPTQRLGDTGDRVEVLDVNLTWVHQAGTRELPGYGRITVPTVWIVMW